MRRQIISIAMLVALVLLGSFTANAKKKPEEPVLESFGANIEGVAGSPSLKVAIQELSTDDEVRQLAQSYARGSQDSLRSAMSKSKKGYFTLGSSQTVRLWIIQAQPVAASRRLLLVGAVPDTFYPGNSPGAASAAVTGPSMVMVGHGRYDYSVIQLEVDEKGNGKGLFYPYCNVAFNKQGQLVITPASASSPLGVAQAAREPYQLVNVHWEK